MKTDKLINAILLKNKDLKYKLSVIVGLFFLFPVFGFLYFANKYEMLNDKNMPLFFLGILFFSFLGITLLRNLFDQITNLSDKISNKVAREFQGERPIQGSNEFKNLVSSFNIIEDRFNNTFKKLEKKNLEIATLKELSELCYVTFDPEEILNITLERSLSLTNSDIGSILILTKTERKSFVVKASIGLGEYIKTGDLIDFETSVAKYAVINKSPLLVKDIEKDKRFARANRSGYSTKSFICMPIKTSKEVVGVLTISRKDSDEIYRKEDVEALAPLLSNASFSYENIRLIMENQQNSFHLKSINKIIKIINSSFRGGELLNAVLNEIYAVSAFDLAVVMIRDKSRPDYISVLDLMSNIPTNISKGARYPYNGSVIDKVLRQDSILIIDDSAYVSGKIENELLKGQGCRSCILAPLKIDGIVKGVLALLSKETDFFKDRQQDIVWMANGLSLAIERSNLTSAIVKRNQELDTIQQIGSALASSTFDIHRVLNYTMDMIREIMNVEAGSLYLVKENELEFTVAFNIDAASQKKLRLKLGQGIAGSVATKGEPIIVNDAQNSPQFSAEVDKYADFKIKSALCVPMISHGKVIGVIEVLNKMDGDFNNNDKDLLHSIVSLVSIALENVRLYRETVSMAEHERDIRSIFQKFVPREVVDKIIHGYESGKEVVEELKTLTLLNIDIRGFSVLTRKIGPQKTVLLLNHFFSVMGSIVFKYHGIVDKYLGDGFLAIFGAPVSSTMDADNAMSAALAMQASVFDINNYFVRELGASITIGISIHTGEVVVGNFGFDMKMDYTVIGDSVNDVFRLQEITKPILNGILISESTIRASRSRLDICEIKSSCDVTRTLGDLKIFELLGIEKN